MTNDRDEERRENEELMTKVITIAEHYGLNAQLKIQAEECCELAKESLKIVRKLDGGGKISVEEGLIDEIADVTFINSQIIYLLDIEKRVHERILEKANRQIFRIAVQK